MDEGETVPVHAAQVGRLPPPGVPPAAASPSDPVRGAHHGSAPFLDHFGGPGMTRLDVNTTLEPSPVTWIRVQGSLETPTDIALLGDTMGLLPRGATIVIDLDVTCELGPVGADALGALARQVAADHGQMIILAEDLAQRTRLVLAEVDHRATLLHTASQVERLLGHAA